jgi:hypothetical protein
VDRVPTMSRDDADLGHVYRFEAPVVDGLLAARPTTAGWLWARTMHMPSLVAVLTAAAALFALGAAVLPSKEGGKAARAEHVTTAVGQVRAEIETVGRVPEHLATAGRGAAMAAGDVAQARRTVRRAGAARRLRAAEAQLSSVARDARGRAAAGDRAVAGIDRWRDGLAVAATKSGSPLPDVLKFLAAAFTLLAAAPAVRHALSEPG